MNTIVVKSTPQPFRAGDIFESEVGEFYILVFSDGKWNAFCLNDGIRWMDFDTNVENIIGTLKFVGRNAKINIAFE